MYKTLAPPLSYSRAYSLYISPTSPAIKPETRAGELPKSGVRFRKAL